MWSVETLMPEVVHAARLGTVQRALDAFLDVMWPGFGGSQGGDGASASEHLGKRLGRWAGPHRGTLVSDDETGADGWFVLPDTPSDLSPDTVMMRLRAGLPGCPRLGSTRLRRLLGWETLVVLAIFPLPTALAASYYLALHVDLGFALSRSEFLPREPAATLPCRSS